MTTVRGRKSSSYFPESENNTQILSKSCTDQNHEVQPSRMLLHCDLTFPSTTTVLWDRTAIGLAVYLRSSSIIPSVLLVVHNVRSILSALSEISSSETVDCRVTVAHRSQLLENEQAVASRPYTGTPYVTILRVAENELNDFGKASSTLTIPIQRSDTDRLSPTLEGSSTRSLLVNLGKAVRKGKEFTLKSCMRMRASGHVVRSSISTGDLNSSLSSGTNGWTRQPGDVSELWGTLRMEAIVPNLSFRAMPVMAAPVADGVVTKQLFSKNKSGMFEFTPKMGYLTMNATRHLIPLLEAGADVIHTPLVGIWVKFEEAPWCTQLLERGEVEQILRHPFVWGACVRFLCSEYAPLKPTLEHNMFRLLLVIGDQAFHYEMAELPGSVTSHSSHSGSPGAELQSEEDFLCANFTVDLATESTEGLNPTEKAAAEAAMGVVCAFRPISRPEQVETFRRAAREAAVTSPGVERSQPHSPLPGLFSSSAVKASPPIGARRSSPWSSADGFRHLEATSIDSAASSLAPRRACPQPAPAPRSPAAGVDRPLAARNGVGAGAVESLRTGGRPGQHTPPRPAESPLPRPAPSPTATVSASASAAGSTSAPLLRPIDQYEYLTSAFVGSRDMLQRQQELELRMYDTQQLVLSLQRELQESRQYIAQLEHRLYSAGGNVRVVTSEESLMASNFRPVELRHNAAGHTTESLSVHEGISFEEANSAATERTNDAVVSVEPLTLDTSVIEEGYRSPQNDDHNEAFYEDDEVYSEQSSFADLEAVVGARTNASAGVSQMLRESTNLVSNSRVGVRDSVDSCSSADCVSRSAAERVLAPASPPVTPVPPPAATGVVKGNTATALSLAVPPPPAPARRTVPERSINAGAAPPAEAAAALVGRSEYSSVSKPHGGSELNSTAGAGNRWAETTFVESESILQIQARYS